MRQFRVSRGAALGLFAFVGVFSFEATVAYADGPDDNVVIQTQPNTSEVPWARHGADAGRPGGSGGHGVAPGNMPHSGDATLHVRIEGDRIIATGTRTTSPGGTPIEVSESVPVEGSGVIVVNTRGVHGYAGGDAGRPRAGRDGDDGRDGFQTQPNRPARATRWRGGREDVRGRPAQPARPGRPAQPPVTPVRHYVVPIWGDDRYPTDGEDGQDTGDAGRPSNGGDGGNAGNPEITLESPALFGAVRARARGGNGGPAGDPVTQSEMPRRAEGGDGGDGIQMYRVTYTIPRRAHHRRTAAFERRDRAYTTRPIRLDGFIDEHVYVRFRVPARVRSADDGNRGRDGRSSPHARAGANGSNGQVQFFVQVPGGELQGPYAKGWRLKFTGFQIADRDGNSRIEPGESVTVSVTVENAGDAPLPAGIARAIMQTASGTQTADGEEFVPELAPGESVTLSDAFSFTGADIGAREDWGPVYGSSSVEVSADVPAIGGRTAPGSGEHDLSYNTGWPFSLASARVLDVLAPGEASRLLLRVQSDQAFSGGRSVEASLAIGLEGVDAEHLVFLDDQGNEISPAEGWRRALENLSEGESELELRVGIRETAPSNTSFNLGFGLQVARQDNGELADVNRPGALTVSIAEKFTPDPDADVVIVVRPGADADEIQAATRFVEGVAKKPTIFQLGSEPTFDLDRRYGDQTLGDYLDGRTVVVVNTPFEREFDPERAYNPDEMLDLLQLRDRLARQDTGIVVINREDRDRNVPSEIAAPRTSGQRAQYAHQEDYAEAKPGELPADGSAHDTVNLITGKWWWRRPNDRKRQATLEELRHMIYGGQGARRPIVVLETRTEKVGGFLFFYSKWRTGIAQVTRTLDDESRATQVGTDDVEALQLAFYLARGFDQNLTELAQDEGAFNPQLVLALTLPILFRIESLHQIESHEHLDLDDDSIGDALTRLNQLAATNLRNAEGSLVVGLHARIRYLAGLTPAPIGEAAIAILDRALPNHFEDTEAAEREIALRIEEYRREAGETISQRDRSPREIALAYLLRPMAGIETDHALYKELEYLLMEVRQAEKWIAERGKAARVREWYAGQHEAGRGDLLIPGGCAELLGGETPAP